MSSISSSARRIGVAVTLALALVGLTAPAYAIGLLPAAEATAVGCTPGYTPCIENKSSDVDCRGGSGNGPRYTKKGVVYRVTGRDRYGLDADHDGKGCER